MRQKSLSNRFTLIQILLSVLILSGCAGSRELPSSHSSSKPGWKNLYFFHCGDSTWIVKPVPSTGNKFSGVIFKPEEVKKSRNIHIYAEKYSEITISQKILSCPMENIVRVDNLKINAGIIITSASVVLLLFLLPVVF